MGGSLQVKKRIQFLTLDALRGLAALEVAVYHCVGVYGGYLAVDFFLVLSGFVLSHSYLYKDNTIRPVEFIGHRLARLYPLHIFTLFTYLFAELLTSHKFPTYKDGTLSTFIQQITLTQNVGLNPSELTYNYPSWSISVEMWLSVVFIFFISKTTKSSVLIFVSMIFMLLIFLNTGHLDTNYTNYYGFINSGLIRGLASFFLGIVSYRMYRRFRNDARIEKYINYFEVLCIIGVLALFVGRGNEDHSSIDMYAPLLFFVLVTVFAFEMGVISKSLKMFSYLGEISYSLYLNQISVLIVVAYLIGKYQMPAYLNLPTYLIVLLGYSSLTYAYIEKPLRSKGREFFARLIDAKELAK